MKKVTPALFHWKLGNRPFLDVVDFTALFSLFFFPLLNSGLLNSRGGGGGGSLTGREVANPQGNGRR